MARNRAALLAALGTDNFGSGLFLPVVLLYVTRVVGLPLATAGTVVSLGTIAGLAAACCGLAIVALRRLSGRLPARAVRPDSSSPGVNTQNQQIQGSVLRAT
jgi:tellurite resistance protein TehA-like permease